jgi:hypothetical protein
MSAAADIDHTYSMMADPKIGTLIARQQIDERVRDAHARHTACAARRTSHDQQSTPRPRRTWRIRAIGRTVTSARVMDGSRERVIAASSDGHHLILRVIVYNRLEEGHDDDRPPWYRPCPTPSDAARSVLA